MSAADLLRLTAGSLVGHRLRSGLTLLAMSIGVGAVVVLTALGEGARTFVMQEFAAIGTNLLIVLPGRTETVGGPPPLLAEVPRDLTVDDAFSLTRNAMVSRVAPVSLGAAPVSHGNREREATIIGSTHDLLEVRHLDLGSGEFLPEESPLAEVPVAVLGIKMREELFPHGSALGRWIRIGDRRFRVVGVLGSRGRSIGLDLDEMVIIPVASALSLFNTESLFRILVEVRRRELVPRAKEMVLSVLKRRHDGEEDITVITQDAVLSTFDRVLRALTLGVAGIAAISLLVAGVLVMNVMLVSVTERTSEIGLFKALGSPPSQVLLLFLSEAAVLSFIGGILGWGLGQMGTMGIVRLYPALPASPPAWAIAAALGTAIGTGLLFGILPARRAAALDPVAALSGR